MKITQEQYEDAVKAAESDTDISATVIRKALWPALLAIGVEVDDSCHCSTTIREYCGASQCHGGSRLIDDEMIWAPRTWIDVREGDIIRPPGQTDETHAAIVTEIGPVNSWHAAPNASQYAPNESPLEWSAMRVTLQPLQSEFAIIAGTEKRKPPFTPEHGMKPDAGVEIKVTRAELNAIEALGGWNERIGVYEK